MTKSVFYNILENSEESGRTGKVFTYFIVTLISLNVASVIIETVEPLKLQYGRFFNIFETISVLIFTIEYLLRLWTCTTDKKYLHPIKGRIRFGLSFLTIVDLLAILPFYLPMIIGIDLRFVRAFRLLRFLRILKLGRYSESLKTLGNVFQNKKSELLISLFICLILLIISSSLMYFVEHEAQPEMFSSIPATMWWGVSTLTTVGYGDVYPITPIGKFFGAIIALIGIGMIALPAGIIASGFTEEIQRKK